MYIVQFLSLPRKNLAFYGTSFKLSGDNKGLISFFVLDFGPEFLFVHSRQLQRLYNMCNMESEFS